MIDSNVAAVAVVHSGSGYRSQRCVLRPDRMRRPKMSCSESRPGPIWRRPSTARRAPRRWRLCFEDRHQPSIRAGVPSQDGRRIPVLLGSAITATSAEPGVDLLRFWILSDLKRSQKELRESEAKFRGFVEAAAEGILEIDSEKQDHLRERPGGRTVRVSDP